MQCLRLRQLDRTDISIESTLLRNVACYLLSLHLTQVTLRKIIKRTQSQNIYDGLLAVIFFLLFCPMNRAILLSDDNSEILWELRI